MTNLLGNALKFTDQGYVRLSITNLRGENHQAWLLFEVQDSGIGMNEVQIERLFKAFSQGDESISRRYGGTGLGLVISRNLVLLMGGHPIEVTSRPGKGSEFSFKLPLGMCFDDEIKNVVELSRVKSRALAKPLSDVCLKGKVLVAEDNPINQEVITELLVDFGLEVVLVADGQEAVERFGKEHFDLVLMDKQMPIMDGYQAAQKIRAFHSTIPIIALTASAMGEERALAAKAGMNDYLSKPIDSRKLALTLARWLDQPIMLNDQLCAVQPDVSVADQDNLSLIDEAVGLKMLGGKQTFYHAMLTSFSQQLPQDFLSIKYNIAHTALTNDQAWLTIESAVHSLKGISANLAATRLVRGLESLEDLMAHRVVPNELFWHTLQSCVEQTQNKIKQLTQDTKAEDK
ncbi:hybrid sensor histidine kinase/response regulator [Thiomicrorhabdus aquaedulcis]|uniref:hybrid sensor histidine kinase/response regulator n=1 Tax=Thiomicrorhabdus aquaedulcis TaxID=2211106 RepID=UPI000FDA9CEE|nr:response regulator [Thiomicrorhabdus aquaedulcis]